jgi:hypothetical protein
VSWKRSDPSDVKRFHVERYSARRLSVAVLLFVGLLTLYVLTLAPGALGGDSGELQFVPAILSLPHPTGTPLYVLLAKVWSLLPLGPSVAWRMNLLAAVSAAVAVTLTFWAAHVLGGRTAPALATALFLAVGVTFWEQAVLADKYAFNALMVALVLGMALAWGKSRSPAVLSALALAYGLSLAHHRSMLVFAPPLLGYVWWYERSALWRQGRRLLKLAALCVLPLLFYLYLPWAEARDLPPGTWRMETLSDWLTYFRDRGYTSQVMVDPGDLGQQLAFYGQVLVQDFGRLGVLVGLIGLVWLLGRCRPEAVFLLAVFAAQVLLTANYRVPRHWVFFLPSFIVFALWIGAGLAVIWQGAARLVTKRSPSLTRPLLAAVTALMLLWPLLTVPARYQPLRASHLGAGVLDPWRQTLKSGLMADRLGRAIADVAPNAVIIGDWEQATPLWYFQQVEGLRPDVQIVYPVERLDQVAAWGRPIYLARAVADVTGRWHPSSLGPLAALQQAPSTAAPPDSLPIGLDFGGIIELAAAEPVASEYQPGQVVPLTIYWRALQQPTVDYSVSLRLLDAESALVAQVDSQHPVIGMAPTSQWQTGQVVGDYYELQLPFDLSPGEYRWGLVLYRSLPDGRWENLQLSDSDRVIGIGGTVQVGQDGRK